MKQRVLYFVEAMGGGIFTYLVDLANELKDEFEITIAYALRPETPPDYQSYFAEEIHLIRMKNLGREIDWRRDWRAVGEMRQIAAEVKPDVIHLHSSKAGAVGRLAFDGKDCPVFYTPHGYSFLMQDSGREKRWLYWMIEFLLARRRCTILSCSRGEHRQSLRLTRRAHCINNAINVKRLDRQLQGIEEREHPFTVFTLGRICPQKNPNLFETLASELPAVKFIWIGDGEQRELLQSQNITVTGWLEREAALQIALNADVFWLGSLWEGLPISLLEAMYLKKPCVVSNCIGNRDVIHNGQNGYLCTRAEAYRAAIEEIRQRGAEELIENAYRDILEQYETRGQARQYSAQYRRGCEGRQGKR